MKVVAVVDAGCNYSLFVEHFDTIREAYAFMREMVEDDRVPGCSMRLVDSGPWGESPAMDIHHPDDYIPELDMVDGYPLFRLVKGPRGGVRREAT